MNKSEFKEAYNKISLCPEFAAQAKAKLIGELDAPKNDNGGNDIITLGERAVEVNPTAKTRRRIGAAAGAAAVLAVALGVKFVPWGDFVGSASSEISPDTTSVIAELEQTDYYKCGRLSYGKIKFVDAEEPAAGSPYENGTKALEVTSAIIGTNMPEGTVFYDEAADHGDSWAPAVGSFKIIPEKSWHTGINEASLMLESGSAWVRADITYNTRLSEGEGVYIGGGKAAMPDESCGRNSTLISPESYIKHDFLIGSQRGISAARGELGGVTYYAAQFNINNSYVRLCGANCTAKQFADVVAMLIYGEAMPEAPEGSEEIADTVSADSIGSVTFNMGCRRADSSDEPAAKSMTDEDISEFNSYIDLENAEIPLDGTYSRTVNEDASGKALTVAVENGEEFVRVSVSPNYCKSSGEACLAQMQLIRRNMDFGALPPIYRSELLGCSSTVYFAKCQSESRYLAGWIKNSSMYVVVEANVNGLTPEQFAELVQTIADERTEDKTANLCAYPLNSAL